MVGGEQKARLADQVQSPVKEWKVSVDHGLEGKGKERGRSGRIQNHC